MSESQIKIERTQNLWASFARSLEPMARSITVQADPNQTFDGIGGLAGAKDEILTYAYAAIQPEIYSNWGTFPPSGLLLIGAIGWCAAMAGLADSFGFPSSIAAFLAGVALSEMPQKHAILPRVDPLKVFGLTLYFIYLGFSLDVSDYPNSML